jgi:phosphoserine phosphatase RsbU/P
VKILIVEDDSVTRHVMEAQLLRWGHTVVSVADGDRALVAMREADSPRLAILDWMLPGMDGLELCRRIRVLPDQPYVYIVMLTSKSREEDIVAAFQAGADDFLSKPAHPGELRGRVEAGIRLIDLQVKLTARVGELERALEHIRTLQSLLPICCYCKRIRQDQGYWAQLEVYLAEQADVHFSHGICPDCYQKHIKPELVAAREASKLKAS